MEASRATDCHGCIEGNDIQQADVEQAYVQAELKGTETWVQIPVEWWPPEWYNEDGSCKYDRPVVRLLMALYGHPDSGTFENNTATSTVGQWGSCQSLIGPRVFIILI